eukprot:08406.XXX_383707_383808_1 [CDS] Oithona nana genome sequencing.
MQFRNFKLVSSCSFWKHYHFIDLLSWFWFYRFYA